MKQTFTFFILLLCLAVSGQTISYQLDMLDVEPDSTGDRIRELADIDGRLYWALANNTNYISFGTPETTISFPGGLGIRDGIRMIGSADFNYYFYYEDDGEGYIAVMNALVPVPELIELPHFEDRKYTPTVPVMYGGKFYAMRERTDTSTNSRSMQLISGDPVAGTSRVVVDDVVPSAAELPAVSDPVLVGDKLLFGRVQSGGFGPAVLDLNDESVTDLGSVDATESLSFERVGDHTLLRFAGTDGIERTHLVTPTGIGTRLNVVARRRQSVALNKYLLTVGTNDTLYSVDYQTGAAAVLSSAGPGRERRARFLRVSGSDAIFVGRDDQNQWILGRTNGTVAQTRTLDTLDKVGTTGPKQFAQLGSFAAFVSDNNPVYLVDLSTEAVQEVVADFNFTGPNPALAAIGDRLYFAAKDPDRGEQIHFLTIDAQPIMEGSAYRDRNGNGTREADEPGIEGLRITIGGDTEETIFTDENGNFSVPVEDGNTYTVSAHPNDCHVRTTSPETYTLSYPADAGQQPTFGYTLQEGAAEMYAVLNAGRVRCNEEVPFWLAVRNRGCLPMAGEATVLLPDNVSLVSTDPDTLSSTDSTLTFAFDTLQPDETYYVLLKLRMPDETNTGDTIRLRATIAAEHEDGATDTVVATLAEELRCAYDPNDKLVYPYRPDPTGSNYTQLDERLRYTIRFQNWGNDTAFRVCIEDELSEHLDPETIQPIAASHSYVLRMREGRMAEFSFPGIELPDSATDWVASQGFVTFEIDLHHDLPDFTVVENKAGIYFDFNRPVVTNTVVSTVVEDLDKDDDGTYFFEDCDDNNPMAYPGAIEVLDNNVDEDCDGIAAMSTVATLDPTLDAALTVYPNPTRGRLHLRYAAATPRNLRLTVLDATGRRLLRMPLQRDTELSLADRTPGIYLLRIEDVDSGAHTVRRVVVH